MSVNSNLVNTNEEQTEKVLSLAEEIGEDWEEDRLYTNHNCNFKDTMGTQLYEIIAH